MGAQFCHCKRGDPEEEFINNVFYSLKLKEMNVSLAYEEFFKCVSNNSEKTEKIEYNHYQTFVNNIVNPVDNREAQIEYFQNLILIHDIHADGIKRIGNMIIFLSDGSYEEKVDKLESHIFKYYGKLDRNLKDFINDVIECETEICLLSFKQFLSKDSNKTLGLIWKKQRKQKLINKLMDIYEEIKLNFDHEAEKDVTLISKFLDRAYNNLTGESIRFFLYEEYLNEGNKITI